LYLRYSLVGSSGCGKTTLINCIIGHLTIDAGQIKVFGDSPASLKPSRFGYMPQETALVENFKIKEMLWFFGMIFGMTSREITEKTHFLADLLELPDIERLVKNCSGGQQRRISFAVTLMHDPELLILDEPTVGADPLLRERIWNHLVDLVAHKNVTVLLTTHYIDEAKKSSRIGLMRNGVLLAENTAEKIVDICGTENMEQAFDQLSKEQALQKCLQNRNNRTIETMKVENISFPNSKSIERKPKIYTALLTKLFFEFIRSIGFE
jgi:ABC-type multidrug transport system ATPase subunit